MRWLWPSIRPGEIVACVSTSVAVDAPAAWGLAIHGGVPLVFAHAKHYKFLIIPEINLGITHRTEKSNANPAPPDISHSGFRMDLGGRIGSEIHFGFIGVPAVRVRYELESLSRPALEDIVRQRLRQAGFDRSASRP